MCGSAKERDVQVDVTCLEAWYLAELRVCGAWQSRQLKIRATFQTCINVSLRPSCFLAIFYV